MPRSKRSYSDAQLNEALRLVRVEGYSYARAGDAMGVPPSTVHFRSHAQPANPHWRRGPRTVLPPAAEDVLASEAQRVHPGNMVWDRHDLMFEAATTAGLLDINAPRHFPTTKWATTFLHRHPAVAERKPRTASAQHAKRIPQATVDAFFDTVGQTIQRFDLNPSQIFNMDESGLRLSPAQARVLCDAAGGQPMTTRGRNSPFITVVGCVSAAGAALPPAIIFKSMVNVDFVRACGSNAGFLATNKGQSTKESFNLWVDHFLAHAPAQRPLLLLLDNHASRAAPVALRKLQQARVIVLGLPANTSPILQALDVGFWKPMKARYRRALHDLDMRPTDPAPTEMTKFGSAFRTAWDETSTPAMIKSAWGGAGCKTLPPTLDQLAHRDQVEPTAPAPPPAAAAASAAPQPPPPGYRPAACPTCGAKRRARNASVPSAPGFYTEPAYIAKLASLEEQKEAKRRRKK